MKTLVLASTDYDKEDYIESISVFNAVINNEGV